MEIKSVRELKELVELFGVIKADGNSVVCFGEVESLNSCTEENAKNALDIIKKHKQSDRKEKAYKTYLGLENSDIEKAYKEFYKQGNGKLDAVSEGKDTNELECTCFICSKKIKNKELFKMPFLIRDYLNSKMRVENIEICEKCLDANSWVIRKKKKHEKLKSGC